MPTSTHQKWMKQALRLAEQGRGFVHPNPLVGAVLVKNGKKIGEGWYRCLDFRHAEIEAIYDAKLRGHSPAGATLYVTLEPCCTKGKTPACTEAIIREKIACVVAGSTDSNPRHNGHGYQLLKAAGIDVVTGVMSEECDFMNRAFFKWITTKMPWILAKVATTLDGYMALPSRRRWLSGATARRHVHVLRSQCGAILVGGETIRKDNPRLTVRGVPVHQQPWRVVVTRSGNLPADSNIFVDEHRDRTLIYHKKSWKEVFRDLGNRGVNCVMVEGGEKVFTQLVEGNWIDEVSIDHAPIAIHAPRKVVASLAKADCLKSLKLKNPTLSVLGRDVRLWGLVDRS